MAFIQRLGQLRSPVSTYTNLPLSSNVLGDVRLATDTGDAYTWMISSTSGVITDWKKVTTSSYNDLVGSPSSSALAIDDAVKVVVGLSINVALMAFQLLTEYGAAIVRMFDGVVNELKPSAGLDDPYPLDEAKCENFLQEAEYVLPNKGDLDINTILLIHGDRIQGSADFQDLLRHQLVVNGSVTDTTTKKFGTGSIKFDGTNDYMDVFYNPLFSTVNECLDFWFYGAIGVQPIFINAENLYVTEGQVLSIKKNGSNKIEVLMNVLIEYVDDNPVYNDITVESISTISSNTWTHIAIQRIADGNIQIWINGVLDAVSTQGYTGYLNLGSGEGFSGRFGKLTTSYLNGYLDEIRFSNIERYTTSFTPMTKAYNTASTPAPTPTIVDISSGAKTVTVHGNARMSGTNPLFGNASLYLDGINSYLSLADSDDWVLTADLGLGPIDSYTKLLLHCNGTNGSQSFLDEIGHSITAGGNAQISTAEKKFGTASCLLDGSGDYLSVPHSSDFDFGTGDFTIDMWVRLNNVGSGYRFLYSQQGPAPTYAYIQAGIDPSNKLSFDSVCDGVHYSGYFFTQSALSWTAGVWYHIAFVRSGSNAYIFRDGVSLPITLYASFTDLIPINIPISFGGTTNGYYYIDGNLDEIRVSKGIARWISDFTPSTSEYGATAQLSDYTIDLWIDPLSLSDSNAYIIGQEDSWKLTLDGTSNKYLKYSIIGGSSLIAPIALSLETWQHVAIVQKDGIVKLYVNGVLGASMTGEIMPNTSTVLSVGATSTGTHLFNGFIEEVRVSKGIARWASAFTPPSVEYSSDSYTKLLLPLNVQTVPNMVLQSVGYVSNYVPTSARVVIFEEDIDTMEPNVDLKVAVSRDGGATFTDVIIAKDQEFGDGTLNLFTGSVDLQSQPNGELLVWKLVTQNNKDCRIRGVSLNWR